jgi:CelD/BcsL family acetyltransferase involved in cellulose biosynthesis
MGFGHLSYFQKTGEAETGGDLRMSRIELKSINTLDQIRELRPAWNQLLADSLRPTVFATWEWQVLCAEMFSPVHSIDIIAAYSGSDLVAILPLRRGRVKTGGLKAAEVVSFLGGGITDYNVLVVRKKYLSSVIPVIATHLKQGGRPVDFENILPGSPPDILRRYLLRHGYRQIVYESKTALATYLPGNYKDFQKSLKKKFQKTMRNNQNYMDRSGGYSYHSEKSTPELLETLISLHTARWEDRGESGALARRQIKDFHTALQAIEDKPFDIRYFTIRHNDEIVAILYGFIMNDCYYAYLSGFDAAHNRISPGNMVLNHSIRELSGVGIKVFDMLRGDMKYKQSWATLAIKMKDTVCFPPTFTGRFRYELLNAFMALKRLLPVSLKTGLKSIMRREN